MEVLMDMGKREEWLASFRADSTRKNNERALKFFQEYSGMTPDQMLEIRKTEGRRFCTRVVGFWKWLQETKGWNPSSSSAQCFAVASYFRYHDLPLTLKRLIPNTVMKVETHVHSLEELQKVFKLADLPTKVLFSILRDCPGRISDVLRLIVPKLPSEEIMLISKKEGVPGLWEQSKRRPDSL
jgi:hypothetical protein